MLERVPPLDAQYANPNLRTSKRFPMELHTSDERAAVNEHKTLIPEILVSAAMNEQPLNDGAFIPAFRAGMQALWDGRIEGRSGAVITDPYEIVRTVIQPFRSKEKVPKFKDIDTLEVLIEALQAIADENAQTYELASRYLGVVSGKPEGPLALVKNTSFSDETVRNSVKLVHSTVGGIIGYTE